MGYTANADSAPARRLGLFLSGTTRDFGCYPALKRKSQSFAQPIFRLLAVAARWVRSVLQRETCGVHVAYRTAIVLGAFPINPPLNQSLWALLIASLTAFLGGASYTFQRWSNASAGSAILNEMGLHN
jgi:hypothetical protein